MKVKEIDRTANVSWSPSNHHPIYLAAGTAAQQLDATFNTTAALEIYGLNLTEPGLDMTQKGTIPSDFRYHKIAWGAYGMTSSEFVNGIIVGGSDGGNLLMYNPAKMISGDDPLVCHKDKHTGSVRSLDFNPFQSNLVASGASESEIYIWDLQNPNAPMTPGTKMQPLDEVTCVSWNRQVQHILGSTFSARCIVWDLRKNEPIIKISDSMSNMKCKVIAWHPDVATQLCLASEDDHTPFIQLWDLRFATSPLKCLEGHQRGVLSIAWCQQEPDLLLSCGKDNRILCWNPNTNNTGGEIVCELPVSNQWSFDVSWCPRNPSIIASSSFDGHISVYSLMGGQQQVQSNLKIADSFPGSESFYQQPASDPNRITVSLKRPPKWLRRPVGASFGFGGRLVTFENVQSNQQQQHKVPGGRVVHISQVVNDCDLISRSKELEDVLVNENYVDYCNGKIACSDSTQDQQVWSFLQANFDPSPHSMFLSLLGYNPQDVQNKINNVFKSNTNSDIGDSEEIIKQMSYLGTGNASDAYLDKEPKGEPDVFDAITSTHAEEMVSDLNIAVNEDIQGFISQALLVGNLELAVDLCLKNDLKADAILLAMTGGSELMRRTKNKYFKAMNTDFSKLIAAVVNQDWEHIVKTCNILNWKEALVGAITYGRPEEFSSLCEILGRRLEAEQNIELKQQALLCYICSGNVEQLTNCWVKCCEDTSSSIGLQKLVEVIMILTKAVQAVHKKVVNINHGTLGDKLCVYAEMLASQGSLTTALSYLSNTSQGNMGDLYSRLYIASGYGERPTYNNPVATSNRGRVPTPSQPSTGAYPYTPQMHARQPQQPSANMMNPTRMMPSAMDGNMNQPMGYPSSNIAAPPQMAGAAGGGMMPGLPPSNKYPLMPQEQNVLPPQPPPQIAQNQTPGQGNLYSRGNAPHRYPSHAQDPSLYSQPSFSQPSFGAQPSTMYPVAAPPAPVPITGPPQSHYNPYGPAGMKNEPVQQFAHQNVAPPNESQIAYDSQVPRFMPQEHNPGWNDPPPLMKSGKAKPEFEPPPPITQPLFGIQPAELEPMAPYAHPNPGYIQQPNMNTPSYSQQIYQGGPQQQHVTEPPAPVAPVEPPKPKGPIPVEHQIIQSILEGLRNQLLATNPNPQMKRKLDDVCKKLEVLYNKLRNNELSPNTINGLHQIIQLIQNGDFPSGLQVHTQMVSTGTFSEISGFMPGIKVLLQAALQLPIGL